MIWTTVALLGVLAAAAGLWLLTRKARGAEGAQNPTPTATMVRGWLWSSVKRRSWSNMSMAAHTAEAPSNCNETHQSVALGQGMCGAKAWRKSSRGSVTPAEVWMDKGSAATPWHNCSMTRAS